VGLLCTLWLHAAVLNVSGTLATSCCAACDWLITAVLYVAGWHAFSLLAAGCGSWLADI